MTQPSLWNVRHAGFTSVSDCRNPFAYLLIGEEEQRKAWGNRTTHAALKGQPVTINVMLDATVETSSSRISSNAW